MEGRYWGHSHRTTQAVSQEQLKAFLDAAEADTALQEKLTAAGMVPDAVSAIAKEAGFLIPVEELTELSDKELGKVAGGTAFQEQIDTYRRILEDIGKSIEEIKKGT